MELVQPVPFPAKAAPPALPALASRVGDAGCGSVWPVAVLVGASASASLAFGAWFAGRVSGEPVPWTASEWVAEHAVWGTLAGALVSLVLRCGAHWDPTLRDPTARRAAAARLAGIWVAVGVICLTAIAAGGRSVASAPILGLLLGAALWILAVRAWLGDSQRLLALPRLDPVRVAVLLAVLTLPLRNGIQPEPGMGAEDLVPSLWTAWRVMLGG
jgi:hypothetical protein